jgi:hypothetical protein
MPGVRWNHNIHYWPLLLAAAPDPCDRALDVGCGEGMLAREVRRRAPGTSPGSTATRRASNARGAAMRPASTSSSATS